MELIQTEERALSKFVKNLLKLRNKKLTVLLSCRVVITLQVPPILLDIEMSTERLAERLYGISKMTTEKVSYHAMVSLEAITQLNLVHSLSRDHWRYLVEKVKIKGPGVTSGKDSERRPA